jgi:hypothetical protein
VPPRLLVDLSVTPERVTQESLDSLRVDVSITNEGSETIDTQLPSSTLLVDGRPSSSWNLAIGNGARDARESALPPGQTVQAARIMGDDLVRDPGEHEILLEVRGVPSAPARVVVDAA